MPLRGAIMRCLAAIGAMACSPDCPPLHPLQPGKFTVRARPADAGAKSLSTLEIGPDGVVEVRYEANGKLHIVKYNSRGLAE